MSDAQSDSAEKSFEATPQKLQKAREKGEVAKSAELGVAATYLGLLLGLLMFGMQMVERTGSLLMIFFDQPDRLAPSVFEGDPTTLGEATLLAGGLALLPVFVVPMIAVILTYLAQRAWVFAPTKLAPKMSRISLIGNAKNKFGRAGLFEFFKSFVKLVLYSVCLAIYLRVHLPDMVSAANTDAVSVVQMMGRLGLNFLWLAVLISVGLGAIDAVFQFAEHRRKNMMTRKEIMDETKDAEGDPHMKQKRRQKGQSIAMNQMMGEVPEADVVIVNPTHYATALKWSRLPGSAPICVAKGVDEVALTIREKAVAAGVPVHSDPPTARALYASVEIGQEIPEDHYRAVAAAIRFADEMRLRARGRFV